MCQEEDSGLLTTCNGQEAEKNTWTEPPKKESTTTQGCE